MSKSYYLKKQVAWTVTGQLYQIYIRVNDPDTIIVF